MYTNAYGSLTQMPDLSSPMPVPEQINLTQINPTVIVYWSTLLGQQLPAFTQRNVTTKTVAGL